MEPLEITYKHGDVLSISEPTEYGYLDYLVTIGIKECLTQRESMASVCIKSMKKYAIQVANKALEDAADNATIWVETPINGAEFNKIEDNLGVQTDPFIQKITVHKQSIFKTEIITP